MLPARFATATAVTTTPAAAVAAEAISTAVAVFPRASFIHFDGAATEVRVIQALNGGSGLVRIRHFHECESARLTGVTVANDAHAFHSAERRKSIFQIRLGRLVRNVSNENICQASSPKAAQRQRLTMIRRANLGQT
jgi:hypothetical protein